MDHRFNPNAIQSRCILTDLYRPSANSATDDLELLLGAPCILCASSAGSSPRDDLGHELLLVGDIEPLASATSICSTR